MAKRNLGVGLLGGVLQVAAYWIVVWAMAIAPMAMVSGLRETSVLFAALISTFVLNEGFGVWRFISASSSHSTCDNKTRQVTNAT